MNDLALSSSAEDAAALEAIEQHHAELAGALDARVSALLAGVPGTTDVDGLRADLVGWCETRLVPHAKAEEAALYPAGLAMVSTRLLVEAMLVEHVVLGSLVEELRTAVDPLRVAASACALRTLFETHIAKENGQLLPALAVAPETSLAALLDGIHEALDADGHAEATTATPEPVEDAGEGCGCGEHDAPAYPELDARAVPHAIRHATVFGALDAVRPGRGLVLVAPHDPLPLLAQLERREPGVFEVSYVERGPEAWRLQLVRRTG